MPFQRVALIFDQRHRPETTGTYCLRALRNLVPVQHVPPEEVDQLSENQFDLFIRIDDGFRFDWRDQLHPSVYWAIDTHLDFDWALEQSRKFDVVFAAQRDGASRLKVDGISTSKWLPLACDPDIHRPHDLSDCWNVSFVGHVVPGERQQLVELIQQRFPRSFVGQRFFEEMAQVYSQSQIVFNRSVKNDINMRVFEALACGSLLVTNDLTENGLAELFQDKKHLITYQDATDLVPKLMLYLADKEARVRIAETGHREVLANHTYRHRMQTLLEEAKQFVLQKPISIPATGPQNEAKSSPTPSRSETSGFDRDSTDHKACGNPKLQPRRQQMQNRNGHRFPTRPKDPSYFEFSRPDVLDLVPSNARRVLDVGCGAGRLGEALKHRQDAEVVGIELDETAAQFAMTCLDLVVQGNIETDEIGFSSDEFDCVICADVLEHLRCPEQALEKIRRWLKPDGVLIASLPNVRHHHVVRSLLAGNWTYETAGLLDQDHVRFFTRREMEKLFYRSGFSIVERRLVTGPDSQEWQNAGRSPQLSIDGFSYRGQSAEDAEEFFVYQFLFVAAPNRQMGYEPTSIVMVTHNQLAFTRGCLDSIRFFTDEPYELIVVDNGSTDGTPTWLKRQPDVRLIENAENRGFPAAVNQGLNVASGSQIVLLNNDTLVTTGWLRRMLDACNQDPNIGLVGPCSNNVSGPQQIATTYRDLAELDGFAWDWAQNHRGKIQDVERLVGFCLLIRQELLEEVGGFDERFGIGCFEDDDYCRRARNAGHRAVIAKDAFVHHFGSQTFHGSGLDFTAILEENRLKYEQKWAADIGSPSRNTETSSVVNRRSDPSISLNRHPQGGFVVPPCSIDLSLCMIVRDNEDTIRACLESIKPYVNEMIVVDTGSADRTPVICREMGARVEHFPWCDDFSRARNESLKYARGNWIFWMDSDDTIPPECGRGLQALVQAGHSDEVLGYVMQVHCPGRNTDDGEEVTIVDHVKLFRNRPDLQFEHRIHEQILPAIRRVGGIVEWTDLFVIHSGADRSPQGEQRKLERDLRILQTELIENPNHPFVLFNLGMTFAHAKRSEDAVPYLEQCLTVSGPEDSHVRKAYSLLVGAHMQADDVAMAIRCCETGLRQFPEDTELQFRAGVLYHRTGRLNEAVSAFEGALKPQSKRRFQSVVRGLDSYLTRHNLALVFEDLEQWNNAEAMWREVLLEQPESRIALRGLGHTMLKQGKTLDVAQMVADFCSHDSLQVDRMVLEGQLAATQGDYNAARRHFEQAIVAREVSDSFPLHAYCRFLFERVDPCEAGELLLTLAKQEPSNPSVQTNLGLYYRRVGDKQKAIKAFQRSLKLRPGSVSSRIQLAETLDLAGEHEAAQFQWRKIREVDPRISSAS